MNRSAVRKENHKTFLVIEEHLVTLLPTTTPAWTRYLRWDEKSILGMNAQINESEGNSKSLLHSNWSEQSQITQAKLKKPEKTHKVRTQVHYIERMAPPRMGGPSDVLKKKPK
jgi:hypothetical protein